MSSLKDLVSVFLWFSVIFTIFFALAAYPVVVFGQDAGVPEVDPIAALVDLIKNWKAITPIGLGIGVVTILVGAIRKFASGFKYSRVAVAVLSAVYGILLAVTEGLGWGDGAIFALLTGGGAVAIYEAWKGTKKTVANVVASAVQK